MNRFSNYLYTSSVFSTCVSARMIYSPDICSANRFFYLEKNKPFLSKLLKFETNCTNYQGPFSVHLVYSSNI